MAAQAPHVGLSSPPSYLNSISLHSTQTTWLPPISPPHILPFPSLHYTFVHNSDTHCPSLGEPGQAWESCIIHIPKVTLSKEGLMGNQHRVYALMEQTRCPPPGRPEKDPWFSEKLTKIWKWEKSSAEFLSSVVQVWPPRYPEIISSYQDEHLGRHPSLGSVYSVRVKAVKSSWG